MKVKHYKTGEEYTLIGVINGQYNDPQCIVCKEDGVMFRISTMYLLVVLEDK